MEKRRRTADERNLRFLMRAHEDLSSFPSISHCLSLIGGMQKKKKKNEKSGMKKGREEGRRRMQKQQMDKGARSNDLRDENQFIEQCDQLTGQRKLWTVISSRLNLSHELTINIREKKEKLTIKLSLQEHIVLRWNKRWNIIWKGDDYCRHDE